MEKIKQIYGKALDSIGDYPSWSKDWKWLAVCSLFVYVINLAFRMSFAGKWDHPELWVNGERIMATHDAYFWLAKAKGFGVLAGYPFAEATRFIHDITGLGFGTIGFWAPAVMGACVGVVCVLWGWLLGGRNAAILAGLIGGLTPGFFVRSRLGYFDTDLFTLLMPLFVAWLLAYWTRPFLKKRWFHSEHDEDAFDFSSSLWTAFAFGLLTRFAGIWHLDITNVTVLFFFLTAFVLFVNGRSDRRVIALYGLSVYLLAAFPGASYRTIGLWPLDISLEGKLVLPYVSVGLAGGVVLAVSRFRRDCGPSIRSLCYAVGLLVLLVLLSGLAESPVQTVYGKIGQYFFPAGEAEAVSVVSGPLFPSILQSIIEARLVPLAAVLERGTFVAWLGWVALGASVIVAVMRPAAAFLFPLIVLHLASVKLGVRFTMFGGAGLMVCLAVSLAWLTDFLFRSVPFKRVITGFTQVAVALGVLIFIYGNYNSLALTAVIPKARAEGLVELGKKAPSNSMVWTWWDWGYATMYYAGLEPVADGGKHSGEDVYPCAFVLSSHSPKRANGMIGFSSQFNNSSPFRSGLSPAEDWAKVPRSKIDATLDAQLLRMDYPPQVPQYLVVSWKDLTLAKWITYFGNWGLETGKTQQSKLRTVGPGQLGFNRQRGMIQDKLGRGGLVSDIDILDWDKVTRQHYGMNAISMRLLPETPHLIANKVTGQTILADDLAYDSMMFRLMVGDPDDPEISKYFKLVVEKLPFVRIYEVVQNPYQ